MKRREPPAILYRRPEPKDGSEVWRLVRDSGGLDLNSAYSYLMLCDMFRDTCCIAQSEDRIVGFVSAFRKPADEQTLFVWQIAVDGGLRGRGVGRQLLRELTDRKENAGIRYLEATIGPNNIPSRSLFLGMAQSLNAECTMASKYESGLFPNPEGHDDELLFRIGPFDRVGLLNIKSQRTEEIHR
ncbi:diaminobutyrate acetyltransferase [Paenibacillus agaridevorans]|jgi:L-2,4-diaminobutyric acid acetyltransferase|nr:diaminobutyrate acetyltransferase [Paenibacillus agaridevorans]